jgi:hypothetical protein
MPAKRITYETTLGERIQYPEPAPEVAAYLDRVKRAAEDPKVSENALIDLVYSAENPLLEKGHFESRPDRGAVTTKTLKNPIYHVMADLLQLKAIKLGRASAADLEASYTQSVSDAARALGISETAVRKAIHAGKLVAIEKSFGYLIDPRSTEDYGANRKPRGGAREPALRLAYGNEPGKSFRAKFAGIRRGKQEKFKDGQITPCEVDTFERGIFIITGREMHRAFVVVPSSRVHRYEHGRFFIEGRFKFAEKINNAEQASKAFREFEPS